MLPFECEIVKAASVELRFNKNIDLAMGGQQTNCFCEQNEVLANSFCSDLAGPEQLKLQSLCTSCFIALSAFLRFDLSHKTQPGSRKTSIWIMFT